MLIAFERSTLSPILSCFKALPYSATIWMRAGDRDNWMIALSRGRCKLLFDGVVLRLPFAHATGPGKLQVQPCPQCPVSDGRPESGGLRDGPLPDTRAAR
jgi:hypothetical protein